MHDLAPLALICVLVLIITSFCSCVGQLMVGGEAGPEVMRVMQQIAASIGGYSASANQAAATPATAADILEDASKEFLVRAISRPHHPSYVSLTLRFSLAAARALLRLRWTSAASTTWMTRS